MRTMTFGAIALYICPVPKDLPDRSRWAHLRAIGITVNITRRDGKDCVEVRYYILSKYISARRFAEAVRGHWGIENNLHWQLDGGCPFCKTDAGADSRIW